MQKVSSISDLPNVPAVYAMYGGRGSRQYVAYVGVADLLRQRIVQHLVRRDSSVTTGTAAVGLNPNYITEVRWWAHPDFGQRAVLTAAEEVAFDVLNPALRSRGATGREAKLLYEDSAFNERMHQLFATSPSGSLTIPSLQDALARIDDLEQRLSDLEARVG